VSPITWRRTAEPNRPTEPTSPTVRGRAPVGAWRAAQLKYESARRAWRSKRTRERESPTAGLRDREF
jgi:hypothetical protein